MGGGGLSPHNSTPEMMEGEAQNDHIAHCKNMRSSMQNPPFLTDFRLLSVTGQWVDEDGVITDEAFLYLKRAVTEKCWWPTQKSASPPWERVLQRLPPKWLHEHIPPGHFTSFWGDVGQGRKRPPGRQGERAGPRGTREGGGAAPAEAGPLLSASGSAQLWLLGGSCEWPTLGVRGHEGTGYGDNLNGGEGDGNSQGREEGTGRVSVAAVRMRGGLFCGVQEGVGAPVCARRWSAAEWSGIGAGRVGTSLGSWGFGGWVVCLFF